MPPSGTKYSNWECRFGDCFRDIFARLESEAADLLEPRDEFDKYGRHGSPCGLSIVTAPVPLGFWDRLRRRKLPPRHEWPGRRVLRAEDPAPYEFRRQELLSTSGRCEWDRTKPLTVTVFVRHPRIEPILREGTQDLIREHGYGGLLIQEQIVEVPVIEEPPAVEEPPVKRVEVPLARVVRIHAG